MEPNTADPMAANTEAAAARLVEAAIAEGLAALAGPGSAPAPDGLAQAAADLAPLVMAYTAETRTPGREATAARVLAHLRAQAVLRAAAAGLEQAARVEGFIIGAAVAAARLAIL